MKLPVIRATLACSAALLMLTGSAQAATLTFDRGPLVAGRHSINTITLRAQPGERNQIELRPGLRSNEIHIQYPANSMSLVTMTRQCRLNSDVRDRDTAYQEAVCAMPRYRELRVYLGDGDDSLDASQLASTDGPRARRWTFVTAFGGAGSDRLVGSSRNDRLDGGPGSDILDGGPGDDVFVALARVDGHDTMAGGSGIDIAAYGARRRRVELSLDGIANDGSAGERDMIGLDVEQLGGGLGDDVLTGDEHDNWLGGGPGADTMFGLGGDDTLMTYAVFEEPYVNHVSGGEGNDHAYARRIDELDSVEDAQLTPLMQLT